MAASGYSYFTYDKQKANDTISNKFFTLLNSEHNEANDKEILSFANSNNSSYSAMFYIIEANRLLAQGKEQEFQDLVTKVADGDYPSFFKDEAMLTLINFNLDKGNIKIAKDKLSQVNVNNSLLKRFFILCRASIDIEEKKYSEAEKDLKSLIDDPLTSSELKESAKNLLKIVQSGK